MKTLLREPLLHFLLLGAAIFLVHRLVTGPGDSPDKIVVTQGQIESLTIAFTRTWQRPPTREELEGLIRDRVREEVYYREAMAMGLDRDDTIIRRRLRQKLEFVTDDLATAAEPTDAELSDYLKAHPDAFRVGGRLTFRHVYLNPEKRGERVADDAAKLLSELRRQGASADPETLGDSFLLERRFERAPLEEIEKQFGAKFAASLDGVPGGEWQGPVESGYGTHLVLVEEKAEGRIPELAEIRETVQREWTNARRLESNEAFFQELLERYEVTVEPHEVAAAR